MPRAQSTRGSAHRAPPGPEHREDERALPEPPDLAGPRLPEVRCPTLLIVGGADGAVLELNRGAQRLLRCPNELVVVPDAAHLFEEPGALEQVADEAAAWFARYLR